MSGSSDFLLERTLKAALVNQFEAAFCTLNACIQSCPSPGWTSKIVSLQFNQVVFHALFFADLYLGRSVVEMKSQSFHADHTREFADYEELEDRVQVCCYQRDFVADYLVHCRGKVTDTVAAETPQELAKLPGFPGREVTRVEMHWINIRHLNHHAAQLIAHLRTHWQIDTPWFQSGWREQSEQ